jgi:hypothetical protein
MKKKTALFFLLALGACAGSGGALLLSGTSKTSVVIESAESKNAALESVYNEIRWIPGRDQDVWMMNQSHFGRNPGAHRWERLAIVIDKTTSPKTAHYYQIQPGPLEWAENLKLRPVPFRASCFTCHNNGPRAIRPQSDSALAPLTWREVVKINLWNLRIKTYGRIVYDPEHDSADPTAKVPFRFHAPRDNDLLPVPVCKHCHQEGGVFARGALRRQQIGTIQHLVKTGQMPPPGFWLSDRESRQLTEFIMGFP